MKRWMRPVMAVMAALASVSVGSALSAASPPEGGTIAIQPKTANGDYDPSMPAFVDAASASLTAKGFLILDDSAHAAYFAELTLDRADVGTALGKARGGPAASMAGAGVSIALPSGKSTVVALRRTRLEMRIRRRTDGEILWQGAAVTIRETGTTKGADKAVAADLGNALLNSYPVVPEASIGVP